MFSSSFASFIFECTIVPSSSSLSSNPFLQRKEQFWTIFCYKKNKPFSPWKSTKHEKQCCGHCEYTLERKLSSLFKLFKLFLPFIFTSFSFIFSHSLYLTLVFLIFLLSWPLWFWIFFLDYHFRSFLVERCPVKILMNTKCMMHNP